MSFAIMFSSLLERSKLIFLKEFDHLYICFNLETFKYADGG